MSAEGKTLPEGGAPAYVTRFDGVRVPATDYRPVWLDSLADDVTIEGSANSAGATAIRPFTIPEVPEAELKALRERIAGTRWPNRELVADRSQGVQLATIHPAAVQHSGHDRVDHRYRRFDQYCRLPDRQRLDHGFHPSVRDDHPR
jgi:hypothetical protein